MPRFRYRTTIQGSLLVLLVALASAAGCSQGSADKSKNALETPVKSVEAQAVPPLDAPAPQAQVVAQLGSPSGTTSIPGNQLPPPDPKFGGTIKEKASESKPWWSPRVAS